MMPCRSFRSFFLLCMISSNNGHLQGNILNDYWTYTKIHDIRYAFKILGLLLSVHIAMVLTSGICLQKGNVKFSEEVLQHLKRYWFILFLQLAHQSYTNFGLNDINMALDFTGSFEWITEEGRLKLICRADDLSQSSKDAFLGNATCV